MRFTNAVLVFPAMFVLVGCPASDEGSDSPDAAATDVAQDACVPVPGSSADCTCECPGIAEPRHDSTPLCEGESTSEALDRCTSKCLDLCPPADAFEGDLESPTDATACTPDPSGHVDCSCQCPGADAWSTWSTPPCVGEQQSEALDRCVTECLTRCP